MATGTVKFSEECHQLKFQYYKNLSKVERNNFLNSFDMVFCDCDGVIWRNMGEGVPGVDSSINYLRNHGKKVTFVTNNSLLPVEHFLKKFNSCGIEVKREDIIYPAQAVCDFLKSQNFDGLIYCLASHSFKSLLLKSGFKLTETENNVIKSIDDMKVAIYKNDPVKAVVIDVDMNLTAVKLMRAQMYLKNPECLFIGGAADETLPFGKDDIIGSGPFINVVENAVKRKASVLGKPGQELGEMLKSRFNLNGNPSRALFIGDSLTTDVRFAKMCGFQTLVVLTGATNTDDLKVPRPTDEIPDFVADSLAELKEHI